MPKLPGCGYHDKAHYKFWATWLGETVPEIGEYDADFEPEPRIWLTWALAKRNINTAVCVFLNLECRAVWPEGYDLVKDWLSKLDMPSTASSFEDDVELFLEFNRDELRNPPKPE